MFTIHKGFAGQNSQALAMAVHVSQETLSPVQSRDLSRYLTYPPVDEMGLLACVPRASTPRLLAERLGFCPTKPLTCSRLASILAGRRADGNEIAWQRSRQSFGKSSDSFRRVVYLGTAFSADKSVSIAWATTHGAEAATILYAHQRAVQAALLRLEWLIGRARRGRDGSGGYERVPVTWFVSEQYAARPTLAVKKEFHVKVSAAHKFRYTAGDPQIHTHVMIPNVAVAEDGRTVALDLRLNGHIHSIGAVYQAVIARELRRAGTLIELDVETGAARLAAVPNRIRTAFSKRVQAGEHSARTFAADRRLDWDRLSSAQRAGLLKAGTQGDPHAAKTDDICNPRDWHKQLSALGWYNSGLLDPSAPFVLEPRETRIQKAADIAVQLIFKAIQKGGPLGEREPYTVAARGLVSTGMDSLEEINAVADLIAETRMLSGKQFGRAVMVSSVVHGRTRQAFVAVDELSIASGAEFSAPLPGITTVKQIEVMRRQGSASVAQGSPSAVVDQIVDRWSLHSQNRAVGAIVVVPTSLEADQVSRAIRQRRRSLGEIDGVDVLCKAVDETGAFLDLSLAAGDRVRLHAHTNATSSDGRRGIIGRAGSIVELLRIRPGGIEVRADSGRIGTIAWETLQDSVTGRARLTYGDAVPASALPPVMSQPPDYILAFPNRIEAEGISGALSRWWRHGCHAVVVAASQQSQDPSDVQDSGPAQVLGEDVWATLADAFEGKPHRDKPSKMIDAFEANLYEAQWAALTSLHSLERLPKLGLRTTLHDRLCKVTGTLPQLELLIERAVIPRRALLPSLDHMTSKIDANFRDAAASLVAHLRNVALRRQVAWLLRTTLSRRLLLAREDENSVAGRYLAIACSRRLEKAALQRIEGVLEGGMRRTTFFFGQELLAIVRARRVTWVRETTLAKRFRLIQGNGAAIEHSGILIQTVDPNRLLTALAHTEGELDAIMSAGFQSASLVVAALKRKREAILSSGRTPKQISGLVAVTKRIVGQWVRHNVGTGPASVEGITPTDIKPISALAGARKPVTQEELDYDEAFGQVARELADPQYPISMMRVTQRALAIKWERETTLAEFETEEARAKRRAEIRREVRIPELVDVEDGRLVGWNLVCLTGAHQDRAVFIASEAEWLGAGTDGLRGLGRELGLEHGTQGVTWEDWSYGTYRIEVARRALAEQIARRFTVYDLKPGKLPIHIRLARARRTLIGEKRLMRSGVVESKERKALAKGEGL